MAHVLIKYWQITLLVVFIVLALVMLITPGIKLGMDFKGGTLYQIELQNKVSTEEINRIANIINTRIGLYKDATVHPVGGQFIEIQLSETNPVALSQVEARIRQQGKFEATLNGEIVFTGDEIQKVLRGDNSYGVSRISTTSYEWSLPFILNETATKRFTEMTFHKCNAIGVATNGSPNYECDKTIFFLDKPNALIVTSEEQYQSDIELLTIGNRFENIPQDTSVDDLILDSGLTVLPIDVNMPLDNNTIRTALLKTKNAIVSPDVPLNIINDLNAAGFSVTKLEKKIDVPWIWTALGAKQVISLTSGITNENVVDIAQAKQFSTLRITGQRAALTEARADLEDLAILLESGSLPTPVKTISKETISPTLGESFLANIYLMVILAAITVALVIVVRYKNPILVIPIVLTGMSEIVIMLGFLAITQRPIDLAAFAGLIAAIGTGIDSEIVITDEVLGKAAHAHESLTTRSKTALFIIMTAAFTMIAVMGPILLFAPSLPGLEKLYGFAVVAIVGTLIGILITRPAFNKIVQMIVNRKEMHEHAKE
ncbi:MAG: hypothetical protein WCI04_01245 [archaeon]